jgi:hypothetical protein
MRAACKIAGSAAGMEKLYEHTLQRQLAEQATQIGELASQVQALVASPISGKAAATGPAVSNTTVTTNIAANIAHANSVNNVIINIFGAENVSYLRRPEIKDILDAAISTSPANPHQAAKHALTQIGYSVYSNVDHPENITCYIPNKKREDVMVHTGDHWELRPITTVTPEMYNRSMNIMFTQQPFDDIIKYGPLMTEARDHEHDPHFAGDLHRGYRTLLAENKTKIQQSGIASAAF